MSYLAKRKNYNLFFKQIKEQYIYLFEKTIDGSLVRTFLEIEEKLDLIWEWVEKGDVFVSYIAIHRENGKLDYNINIVLEHMWPTTPSTKLEKFQKTIDESENWPALQKRYVSVRTKIVHTRELYCMHIKLWREI